MNFFNKLSVIVNKKYGPNLVEHQEGYYCNRWWCYRGSIETLSLSELKPNFWGSADDEGLPFSDKQRSIEQEIIANGFDYSKGYIVVTGQNVIADGHHRYVILKKVYGEDYAVQVLKFSSIYNHIIEIIKNVFIYYLIRPCLGALFRKK